MTIENLSDVVRDELSSKTMSIDITDVKIARVEPGDVLLVRVKRDGFRHLSPNEIEKVMVGLKKRAQENMPQGVNVVVVTDDIDVEIIRKVCLDEDTDNC